MRLQAMFRPKREDFFLIILDMLNNIWYTCIAQQKFGDIPGSSFLMAAPFSLQPAFAVG